MAGRCFMFVLTSLVAVFCSAEWKADPEFCKRGFQIAGKFHACWQDGTYSHPFHPIRQPANNMYTGEMLETYATHMCSVVKPVALECLRKEVSVCSNADKLMETADASGGACYGDKMNPHFKQYITRLLKPIASDSPCFLKGDEAYKCYQLAATMVLSNSTDSHQVISRFYKVADKFFDYIWSCHIKLYKGMSDVCPNWQIPMLISLQTTAMPSLFGMKLNNHQIAMLELGTNPLPMDQSTTTMAPDCKDKPISSYMLLRLIKDKSVARPGDIVIQLEAGAEKMPELSVEGLGDEKKDFVKTVFNRNGAVNMKALKKWMKEEQIKIRENRRKKAEMEELIEKLKPKKKKKGKHPTF